MMRTGLAELIAYRAARLNGHSEPISIQGWLDAISQIRVTSKGEAFSDQYPFRLTEGISLDCLAHLFVDCGGDVHAVMAQFRDSFPVSEKEVMLAVVLHEVFRCQRNGARKLRPAT